MVSTVLQIEREAEARLEDARAKAETILADAKIRRAAEAKSSEDAIRAEIADLEKSAGVERAKKIEQVNAAGNAALEKVRNISPAAFDKGVQSVLDALAGK
jgi:F0F1-type ATP synthase membrane subunit b/b'